MSDPNRGDLLKSYSEECLTHGTYLLTTIIALFTLLQVLPSISFSKDTTYNKLLISALSNSSLIFFSTIGTFLIGRLFYWAWMTSSIFWTKPLNDQEAQFFFNERGNRDHLEDNRFGRLHEACFRSVRRTHRTSTAIFAGAHSLWLFISMGVILAVLAFLHSFLFAQYSQIIIEYSVVSIIVITVILK